MRKIKLTKSPKTGDQRDFSLVHRQVHYIGEGDANTTVKNTMGAVPREEANIEVEGGETVVGDVNRDGFLEHMTFTGKRHSEGGMPVNIPEGSFIFSDTKKLKIKDKDVLENVFGLSYKKGGYTPAEIAKRYQINKFIQDLKNPEADAITKRSATQMLDNNMQKLGMLALVQESMKGFPDGVPAIAESVMAGLQGEPAAEMPQAKNGGMTMYQKAGEVGHSFYINSAPNKISKRYKGFFGDEWVVFEKPVKVMDEDGNPDSITEMKLSDWNKLSSKGMLNVGYQDNFIAPNAYTSIDNLTAWNQDRSVTDIGRGVKYNTLAYSATEPRVAKLKSNPQYQPGYQYKVGNKTYQVVDAQVYSPYGTEAGNRRAVRVKQISDPDQNIGSFFDTKFGETLIPLGEFNRLTGVTQPVNNVVQGQAPGADVAGGTSSIESGQVSTDAPAQTQTAAPSGTGQKAKQAAARQTTAPAQSAPAAPARPSGKPKNAQEALNYFMLGGQYQDGGMTTTVPKEQLPEKTNQRVDPNQEIFVGNIELADGTTVQAYYKGSEKYVKDSAGNIIARGTRTDTQFSQYGSPNINQLLAKTPNVRYTNVNFGTFGQQPRMGNTGIYLSSGNAQARKSGDLSAEEWQDFKDRHGDWIDKDYKGGFEQYKKDLLAGQATGDKAADWFQGKVNEKSRQQFGVDYFADPKAAGNNPYKRDSKFGQVTYSVPRFFDAPVTSEKPKEEPKKPEVVVREDIATPQPRRQGPWWLQDIVNFTGTLTDRVNRYEPTQGRVSLQTPGYVLEDPTRRLAANQEQMARLQEQAMNTTDGNVALASMLGATGQGFANAANVLGEVEGRNVNTVNQAYLNNAQIRNQETVANETGRQKYVEDMATLNQQMDNAEQQKKWRQIAAFNNGTTNWFRKKQMEQVLFPQVYVDPITGETEFSGQGRDLFGPDTYSPAYASLNNAALINPMLGIDNWQQIYEAARPTMGDAEAKRYATATTQRMLTQKMQQVTGPTARQNYNMMATQGLTLPAPQTGLPGQQYGGEMYYLPWAELD